eukprot:jgi/Botrbrau1/8568/Bobra.0359s0032.1
MGTLNVRTYPYAYFLHHHDLLARRLLNTGVYSMMIKQFNLTRLNIVTSTDPAQAPAEYLNVSTTVTKGGFGPSKMFEKGNLLGASVPTSGEIHPTSYGCMDRSDRRDHCQQLHRRNLHVLKPYRSCTCSPLA